MTEMSNTLPSYDNPVGLTDKKEDEKVFNIYHALHPWLQLRSRIFLGVFTPALASLLFIQIALVTAMAGVDRQTDSIKNALMDACMTMEASASTLLSAPHVFAANANEAIASTIEQSVRGVARVLSLALTAVQEILDFLVDMYRSLFLCFIQLLVSASLSLLSTAVDTMSGVVHDLAQAARSSIQASVTAINATLRATLGGLNDVLKIIGKSITVPQVSMPTLAALENVTLPRDLTNGLVELNASMPTLQSIRTSIDSMIQQPFQVMQREINDTIAQYTFNRSTLHVPAVQTLDICNNAYANNTGIDALSDDLRRGARIGMLLLLILALSAIALSVVMEWWAWRCLRDHVSNLRLASEESQDCVGGWSPKPKSEGNDTHQRQSSTTEYRLMSLLQLSTHPKVAEIGLRYSHRCGIRSAAAIVRLRWWLAWATHPGLLALLSMGLFGLLAAQMQITVIEVASRRASQTSVSSMDDLVDTMRNAVNLRLANTSSAFANSSNSAILKAQDDLNNGIFTWLNTTTSTIDAALNELMGGLATAVNSTFANTPLFTSVQSFVGCIIGDKVLNVERALDWIQSNARVNFTLVPEDVFALNSYIVQQTIVGPANGAINGEDGKGGLINSLADTYLSSLRRHRDLFAGLILLYCALLLVGLAIVAVDVAMAEKQRKAKAGGEGEQGAFLPPSALLHPYVPPRSDSPAIRSGHRSISQPMLPDVLSLHQQSYDARNSSKLAHSIPLPPYSRSAQVDPHNTRSSAPQPPPPQTQFHFPTAATEIPLQRHSRLSGSPSCIL
jgi:hypothetical protein